MSRPAAGAAVAAPTVLLAASRPRATGGVAATWWWRTHGCPLIRSDLPPRPTLRPRPPRPRAGGDRFRPGPIADMLLDRFGVLAGDARTAWRIDLARQRLGFGLRGPGLRSRRHVARTATMGDDWTPSPAPPRPHSRRTRAGSTPPGPSAAPGAWLDGRPLEDATLCRLPRRTPRPRPGAVDGGSKGGGGPWRCPPVPRWGGLTGCPPSRGRSQDLMLARFGSAASHAGGPESRRRERQR